MRRTHIALAMLALAGVALAQSSTTHSRGTYEPKKREETWAILNSLQRQIDAITVDARTIEDIRQRLDRIEVHLGLVEPPPPALPKYAEPNSTGARGPIEFTWEKSADYYIPHEDAFMLQAKIKHTGSSFIQGELWCVGVDGAGDRIWESSVRVGVGAGEVGRQQFRVSAAEYMPTRSIMVQIMP